MPDKMSENKTPEIKAVAKGIRISPRKVAVVTDLVRRRSVSDALVILEHTERRAAAPVTKLINSAVANARHNLRLPADQLNSLEIQTIMVTDGGAFKRYKFVGAGRRAKPRPMMKRSSHVTIILSSPLKQESKPVAKASVAKSEIKKTAPAKKPEVKSQAKKESKK